MTLLYGRYSRWYPLLTPLEDYAPESRFHLRVLGKVQKGRNLTALELGSGAGHGAYYMKGRYRFTLTDLSPAMLRLSRAINPECRHIKGDMRRLRLEERFDLVFVHDAVSYMRSRKDLRAVIRNASRHCKPGGYAFFLPDDTWETWDPDWLEKGVHKNAEGTLRYLEWNLPWVKGSDQADSGFSVSVEPKKGKPFHFFEVHHYGLFPRKFWMDEIRAAGMVPRRVPDPWGRDLFLARKKR